MKTFKSLTKKITTGKLAVCLLLAGLGMISTVAGRVVDVDIAVGNALKFTPMVTNINTGDSVMWIWQNTSNEHSTTATANPAETWDSGLQTQPFSYTVTFTNAGTYPFFCSRHVSFGMTGEVLVAASLLPPTIGLQSPTAGKVFAAPANVTITAGVTNGSGAVTNVAFCVDSGLVANLTTTPYTTTAHSVAAGGHTLSVVATDTNALTATNSIGISVVTPVAIKLTLPALVSNTNFQFNYSANTGLQYMVQRSTNLMGTNWLTLVTNTAGANPASFTDTNVPVGPEFYRVGLVPNP
jgi:plastocyanin